MTSNIEHWNPGDLIWFDPSLGHWIPGEIMEFHRSANVITVQAVVNGQTKTFALQEGEGQVRRRQDLGEEGVEDMIQLTDLHEAALLWNLKLRYERNLIYTYAGSILIAVNPYKMFDGCYGIESAQKYRGKMIGELPPHLFASAASAYANLPAPQVVVISGESGSGKTESTKLVMQYLAAVAPSAPRGQALVTEQILEATPLLEAFGNARTVRNDNSSRFGKYLEVYFKHGSIIGAKITQYLLEKSRIVTQATGERNYHVFYELLGGLSNTEKQKYGLVAADKYFYLNQGGGDCSPGHSGSGADWKALTRAMEVLGVGEIEQEGILKVLAAVLHLGNIYFHRRQLRHGQEGVEVGSDVEIKWAAHLLQISASGLQRTLTSRVTEARAERVQTPLTIDQALDARDAFAKALYAALFNWLVTRVNSIIQRGGLHDAARICLLDIFGFENLSENSFEQLSINFASESLQLYFNKHVFKLEQQEYQKERLEWTNISWVDNTPVIQLLGKKPVGILHLLDDESNFPRASDASFLEKCHYNHALNENYCRPRVGGREFGIRHFAGQVWYSVDGFLDKNRDILRTEVIDLLAASKEPLICAIAKPLLNQSQSKTLPRGANGRFVTMKPRTPTVAARFSDSLQQLLENMSKCNPWFVRCIKPNNEKTPMKFDMPVVLEQLRYSGMLDTIKIRQAGYPIRMKFQQFVERYRYLLTRIPRGTPYRDLCRAILEQMPHTGTEGPDYQLGVTRVFLRENLERQLEAKRGESLKGAAVAIQKHIRGYLARKKYRKLKRSAITIQKHWKGYRQRRNFTKVKRGVIKTQALYRGRKERKLFGKRKAEFKRRVEAEKIAQERAKQRAAREAQLQAQAQKANASAKAATTNVNKATAVHHLEIPAELAFIFSKLDGYVPTHTERHLVKLLGGVNGSPPPLNLPHDLNQFEFSKFSSVYFKDADLHYKKDPITAPFLSKAAARDQDFQDSVAIFKLILRWSNDPQLTGPRERVLADYMIYKGLNSRGLRDELLVQLCNQTYKNDNSEKIWQLMALCLSCFQPSPPLSKYLLKFITDHASVGIKKILQKKLTRSLQRAPHSRQMPPTLLEWRGIKQKAHSALPLTTPDGVVTTVCADSWTTCEEAAALAMASMSVAPEGWSVIMDDAGILYEGSGLDYIFDSVSELELCPAFPIQRSNLLKFGSRRNYPTEIDHHTVPSPVRPQVPPPEPPGSRKMSRESSRDHSRASPPNQMMINSKQSSRRSSRESHNIQNNYHHGKEALNMVESHNNSRKTSQDVLSRISALNERYFEVEKTRSRSLDNLLNEPEPNPLLELGLSQTSKLNERYHSVEQLNQPIQPVVNNHQGYMSKQEIDFEYPEISSISTRGTPRYIKSQYAGKKAAPGSQSSRAYIEKTEFRSSAMSDTSEAPSLASHVRRVRVPSQASDVDQFLDELFSPVLDGNLDELSDARSLAASIKGGGGKSINVKSQNNHDEILNKNEKETDKIIYNITLGKINNDEVERFNEIDDDFDHEIDNEYKTHQIEKHLSDKLSGDEGEIEGLDQWINEIIGNQVGFGLDLTDANEMVLRIKGGGSRDRSSSQGSSMVDQDLQNPTPPNQNGSTTSNVDDYITDLFSPIFLNDSLKKLAEKQDLIESIKGGGSANNSTASSSYNYSGKSAPVVTSAPLMMPLLSPTQEGYMPVFPSVGINGMPQNTNDIAAYQQNLQRVFLQSAMAQNIQIQQQLLAQNQALQQLLTQNVDKVVSETIQTTVKAQVHQSSPNRKSSFKSAASSSNRKSSSPSVSSSDFKSRKASSDSNQSMRNGIPLPPPMPPPIDEFDTEHRPFLDPYGRAKTVRIGKWRWPPLKDGHDGESSEDFLQFKMRQSQRKVTPNKEPLVNISNGHSHNNINHGHNHSPSHNNSSALIKMETSAEWEILDFEPATRENEKLGRSNSKKAFEIGAARPSPGSIGKIKLSSEMRQRLEMVTANHSVRSSSSEKKPSNRVVNKLEDTRKMMLEQQLRGNWDDGSTDNLSGKSSPESPGTRNGSKSPTQQSWAGSNWKPGPPPPPIGPNSLPPAPPEPAPSPPIGRSAQPPPPVEPVRSSFKAHRDFIIQKQSPVIPREPLTNSSSFMAQRQDRDTFGVHQNRNINQNNSKRNSFSANWEVQSSLAETQDDTSWAKDDADKADGRTSRDSWNLEDSTTITSVDQSRWDREERKFEKNKNMTKEQLDRPTFRTHQLNKIQKEREKKHSTASTAMTDKTDGRQEVQEWPEFMRPIRTPPPSKSPVNNHSPVNGHHHDAEEPQSPQSPTNRLLPPGASAYVTYNRVAWLLRVRKEFFSPSEPLGPLTALHLIFCQIVGDVYGVTPCLRLTPSEKRAGVNMLSGYGVTPENYNTNHRANIKRNVIELARTWPLYFARLFPVSGAAQLSDVELVAVSHWGVHLVKRDQNHVTVLKSFSLNEISSCTAPRPTAVSLDGPHGRISLHTPRAQQLSEMVTKFCNENKKLQTKAAQNRSRSPPSERLEVITNNLQNKPHKEDVSPSRRISRDGSRDGATSPGSPLPPTGKYSLMQFAMQNFKQLTDLEHQRMDQQKPKHKSKEWTWKQQTDVIKWQGTPIDGPLLRLEDPELTPLSIECFDCILRYCGDQPLTTDMSEVKCVYTVLMHCHKYAPLRDEVYCQLMKQTTSNKSEHPESCQRAWRLLSIVAAYFACSDHLLPYLMEHLTSAANDRRRICHGTAAVCLSNLRKTQKCGGRKNVPSVEEVTAVSAGRSARRQIYRLPGGAERVVNTRCSTVVYDVIQELCGLIGVNSEAEQQEFSLYCIVQGDAFTMPLAADEYILDVTTELHKAAQPFYLIFCRSVWYHPLKHDASALYTEVLFNQVAPDYLEGLLLRLGNPNLPPSVVRDMALIASLLHRAADLGHSPNLKEVKFLLPKPVLGLREPRPPQWLALVQTSWGQAVGLSVARAKHRVLQVLSSWPLFGSSFFAVKRVVGDPEHWTEHILALNRGGVHFLDMNTHETLQHWPFAEVISTRKVRSEDGALFLDMKCGNLLQQRVTRLQTEQAHEISRLVRQYINLEQEYSDRSK